MKNLSVIIVSYNTKAILTQAVDALLPQLNPTEDECLVVDNNSTDGTAEMVRKKYPQVKLLALDKDYGYAYGTNRGFEESKGKYVLVMSSDIVFPAGSIARLVEKMQSKPDVGVVCPEFIDFNGSLKQLTWQWRVSLVGELFNKLFSPTYLSRYSFLRKLIPFLQKKERVVSWVSGAAFLIRRTTMADIHGFDEKFQLYYEDTDLFERVRANGQSILFAPSIKAFHALGESTKNDRSKIHLIFVQSRLYYYKKHLSWIQHALLKSFLKMKFRLSDTYQSEDKYRYWADFILNEKGIVQLWEDIQL